MLMVEDLLTEAGPQQLQILLLVCDLPSGGACLFLFYAEAGTFQPLLSLTARILVSDADPVVSPVFLILAGQNDSSFLGSGPATSLFLSSPQNLTPTLYCSPCSMIHPTLAWNNTDFCSAGRV